jgi:hypothetical protein
MFSRPHFRLFQGRSLHMKRLHVHVSVDNLDGNKVYKQILARMTTFVNLPARTLDRHAIQHEIKKIGDTPV